jgi:hypothetical protein
MSQGAKYEVISFGQHAANINCMQSARIHQEFSGVESQEVRAIPITKLILDLMKEKATKFHRSLKIVPINKNSIWIQRYVLSK